MLSRNLQSKINNERIHIGSFIFSVFDCSGFELLIFGCQLHLNTPKIIAFASLLVPPRPNHACSPNMAHVFLEGVAQSQGESTRRVTNNQMQSTLNQPTHAYTSAYARPGRFGFGAGMAFLVVGIWYKSKKAMQLSQNARARHSDPGDSSKSHCWRQTLISMFADFCSENEIY